MKAPVIFCENLEVALKVGPDMANVTDQLSAIVEKSGIEKGSLHASVVGSTGSITTIEFEPGVVEDLKKAIERLAPPGMVYEHEKAWHDGNGHSHVQAAILGPSIVIPVRDGRLVLGTWQQVTVINHDNRSRQRPVVVTIIGES